MDKRLAFLAGCGVLSAAHPGFAQAPVVAVNSPVAHSSTVKVDPGAVSAIAASIRTALARLPANATQADAEAAIVFAIDQAGQSLPVVLAGLNAVNRTGLSPVSLAALDSVRANRARLALRGTGSIAGGPSIGTSFGPAVSVNGGSSDYVR